MPGKKKESGKDSAPGESPEEPLKKRYRDILVAKLTEDDLRELQDLLRDQFDREGNIDRAKKEKFEWKLREYLHEEILTREIPGIEALIRGLKPGDLGSRGRKKG